jgi:hypothetical protein
MTTKPSTDRPTATPTTPPEPKKMPTEVTSEEELTPEELDQAVGAGSPYERPSIRPSGG